MAESQLGDIVTSQQVDEVLRLAKGLGMVDTANEALLKQLKKLQDQLNAISTSSTTAAQQTAAYNSTTTAAATAQDKLIAIQKVATAQQNQLIATEARLSEVNSASNQSLTQKKKQLAEQNELLKLNSILNNVNSGTIEKATAQNRILEIEKRKLNLATKEGEDRLKAINKEQDANNKLLQTSGNEQQRQKINIGAYRSKMAELFTQFKNGEIGLKALGSGFIQLGKTMFLAFIANPIFLAITAIVGVLALLTSVFTSSASGGKLIKEVLAQLNAVFDVVKQRAYVVIEALKALFSGDFKLAADKFKESVSGVGEQMQEAAAAAKELVSIQGALNKEMAFYVSQQSIEKNQIEKLLFLAKDKTKSDTERMAALKEAMKLSSEQAKQEVTFAERQFDIDAEKAAQKAKIAGVTKDQIKEFIALNADEQLAALKTNKELAKAYDILGGSKAIKELEESYAKAIDADTSFFQANKRTQSQLTGFQQELIDKQKAAGAEKKKRDDEALEAEKKRLEEEVEAKKKADDQILKDIEDTVKRQKEIDDAAAKYAVTIAEVKYKQEVLLIRATSKTKEEADKRILELDEANLKTTISNLNEELMAVKDGSAEWYNIKSELAKAEQDLNNQTTDNTLKNAEEIAADQKKKDEERKEGLKQIAVATIGIANQLFDFKSEKLNAEQTALDLSKEKGLITEKEYAVKSAEIEIKQAKNKRAQGVFNAIVDTASAVIGFLSNPGGIPGIVLSVLAGITGGLQVATILSTPLPEVPAFLQGSKGLFNSPETYTVAEDNRPELVTQRSGRKYLFNKKSLLSGADWKGARIDNNNDTNKWFLNHSGDVKFNGESRSDERLISELKDMTTAIINKPVAIFDAQNNRIGTSYNGGSHREYLSNKIRN